MQRNFADLLKRTLSAGEWELIHRVAAEAEAYGLPLYIVGGLPRDLVLGTTGADFDMVVEGDAISLARALAAKYGGTVTAHVRFGTARWSFKESAVPMPDSATNSAARFAVHDFLDLASARSESYRKPAELPRIKPGSLADDLRRRDFTINTLALRLDGSHFGEVRDEFGALNDLQRKTIRVLHAHSFEDDPTRAYRAVRYEQRLGFSIAPETARLIPGAREFIGHLSAHRARHELDLILDESHPASILHRLADLDLLRPVHPALPADGASLNRLEALALPADVDVPHLTRRGLGWTLWLLGLTARDIESINKRLHFTGSLVESLLAASRLHRESGAMLAWKPSRCTAYLSKLPLPSVYAVYRSEQDEKIRKLLGKYLVEWRHIRPTINGHDLKSLGVVPGPVYESILRDLRDAWIDGLIHSAAEERKRLLASLHGTGRTHKEMRRKSVDDRNHR